MLNTNENPAEAYIKENAEVIIQDFKSAIAKLTPEENSQFSVRFPKLILVGPENLFDVLNDYELAKRIHERYTKRNEQAEGLNNAGIAASNTKGYYTAYRKVQAGGLAFCLVMSAAAASLYAASSNTYHSDSDIQSTKHVALAVSFWASVMCLCGGTLCFGATAKSIKPTSPASFFKMAEKEGNKNPISKSFLRRRLGESRNLEGRATTENPPDASTPLLRASMK